MIFRTELLPSSDCSTLAHDLRTAPEPIASISLRASGHNLSMSRRSQGVFLVVQITRKFWRKSLKPFEPFKTLQVLITQTVILNSRAHPLPPPGCAENRWMIENFQVLLARLVRVIQRAPLDPNNQLGLCGELSPLGFQFPYCWHPHRGEDASGRFLPQT
jgi:hypothetical protein